MRLFKHCGDGHHLGSVVIVWAGSKKTAEKMIRSELDSHGLSDEELNIEVLDELTRTPQLIYEDDGDY